MGIEFFMFLFFVFIFGLCVGSFLNVVIDRLQQNESIIAGRSYCDSCKKKLLWYDMFPVFSYLFLKGKCRFCHAKISIQYPAVELTTGILFLVSLLCHPEFISGSRLQALEMLNQVQYDNYLSFIFQLLIISSLIVIFFTDLKYGIIPDKIIYPAVVVSFLFISFTSKESWLHFVHPATFEVGLINYLLSAFGSFLFFLLLYLITRGRGMGFGDVKFAFLMGLFLGFPKIITAFYIAFLTGAIISLILVIWRKKKFRGGTIPFGPFLVFGTLAALFLGEKIGITGYINQLLVLH